MASHLSAWRAETFAERLKMGQCLKPQGLHKISREMRLVLDRYWSDSNIRIPSQPPLLRMSGS
jgi:hypothetical protein